jgi:hypothetical protein
MFVNFFLSDNGFFLNQPTTDLIKEIAVLELEVVYLEQYLLSLYRKAFELQLSPTVAAPSTVEESEKSPRLTTPRARYLEVSSPEVLTKRGFSSVQCIDHELNTPQTECNGYELETPDKEYIVHHPEEKHLDSSVHRCHSSLSQYSAFTEKVSPPEEESTDSLHACYSQPLSMLEVNHVSQKILLPVLICNVTSSTLSCCDHIILGEWLHKSFFIILEKT